MSAERNLPAAMQKPNASVAFSTLPPEAQREHRSRIGARVMAILNQFWTDQNTPDAVRVLEIEGWLDVLAPLAEDEVRNAWREYQITGPRPASGLRRPDAGALYLIAMNARMAARPVDMDAVRQQRAASDRAKLEALAAWINGPQRCPPSACSNTQRDELLRLGLVTPDKLRERQMY